MRSALLQPRVHLFVCTNQRDDGSPLGPGCADGGEQIFDILKAEVARRREYGNVWITRTKCLGLCPREGVAVASYPRQHLWTEVTVADAPALYAQATSELRTTPAPNERTRRGSDVIAWEKVERLLDDMEELQRSKVVSLARRLKPGLTLEDIRNPHDFPELDDKDWHYEDGVLTGIQSVRTALRALSREGQSRDEEP